MLIIEFTNKRQRGQIADYYWRVRVNNQVIAEGWTHGHDRTDGWQALVGQFADEVKEAADDRRVRDLLAVMALSSESEM